MSTPTLNTADMSPIKSTTAMPEITSPGGGTTPSQKRSIAKRSRESESPDVQSRKRAKVEGTHTPSTLPREKNEPKRPHKALSCNGSFNDSISASQLDFSTVTSQPNVEEEIAEESQPGLTLESQEPQDLEVSEPTEPQVHLETLGELDEDMTTPEIVCSTGSEPSQEEALEEEMICKDEPIAATPNCSQASASLDTTQDVDGRDVAVKAVNFAPEKLEVVEAAAASAASVAAVSDDAPAPAAAPAPEKSGYCSVM